VDKDAVLTKTGKGHDEVKSRTHGLSQKLRTLLITVDGSATVGELIARLGGAAEIETNLRALIDQGFVEVKRLTPSGS